jgi:hypothetical protein
MKNSKTTLSVGLKTDTNRNQNPNNGESKMTRQQRRKMERDMKKGNNQRISSEKREDSEIYGGLGFSITDLNTVETYGVITKGFNLSKVQYSQRENLSIYENMFLVDVENNGISSPCIVRVIHNTEEGLYDEEVMRDMLKSTLSSYINSPKNTCRNTLNNRTRFTLVMGLGSELDSSVLEVLNEYLSESSDNDYDTLTSMTSEFGQTG